MIFNVFAQQTPPKHIKSIQLKPKSSQQNTIFAPLGTSLVLSFDDLEADQKEYYYKIEHMTYNWQPSRLLSSQYIEGFQTNYFVNIENSFNTLQNYTHYSVEFPNNNTKITKSGNYLFSIFNSYDELVFSRRFTLYETIATAGLQITRSRNTQTLNTQQTATITVNHPTLRLNNPNQEIHTVVLQNQNWKTAKTDLKPNFFKVNQLIYNLQSNIHFWGGNEYLFFDSKIIRNTSLNIRAVERKELFYNYLFPYDNPLVKNYTYNPDINGQFIIRTLEGQNSNTEADYAVMNFYLNSHQIENKEVYVYGGFNNFELTEENKMTYQSDSNSYTAKILLKQGFYNYTFVTSDGLTVSQSEFRGDFSKTENEYSVIVYYSPIGGLYDRVIAVSSLSFKGNR